ncbi:hypothetical protein Ocin01_14245 [Orchesella cincta]|uniref:Uncharacterized protein n=1 Tax=Orchesella cincta TaxID=48709 RepID=A0A1D2MHM1_ORCCI|nr:hypothetical protein Ocin01_14245 [Orchesella cincta]
MSVENQLQLFQAQMQVQGRALRPGFKPPGFSGCPPSEYHSHLDHFAAAKPKPPAKKGELYLPEDYNNLVIPKLNLGKLIGIDSYSAVPVLVFLNIRSVRDIDESMETLTLDLDLVIEWVDGFLFDPISAITVRQAEHYAESNLSQENELSKSRELL